MLASAAPGGDILCHEVCRELGIKTAVCLPMPKEDFARVVFGNLDAWRSRFLDLVEKNPPLQLSDQVGLPRWLQGSGIDPWERGNRWVLEMARASGARRVSLFALWDGKRDGRRARRNGPHGADRAGRRHGRRRPHRRRQFVVIAPEALCTTDVMGWERLGACPGNNRAEIVVVAALGTAHGRPFFWGVYLERYG